MAKNSINNDIIPRDSLAMRLTLDPRTFDVNEKKQLKEKLKILKDAVLEERRLKNELKISYEEIRSNYEKAIQELESKDQDIIKKQNEISKFRELLILERNQKEKYKEIIESGNLKSQNGEVDYDSGNKSQLKNINVPNQMNQGSILSNVSSLFGFGHHSQQLIKEEQYKDLLEKFQKLNFQYQRLEEKQQEQEDLNIQQMSAYEGKVKIVKEEKEQIDIQYRENQKLLDDLQETNKILVNQQADIKRDNQTFLKKIDDLNNKVNELTKQNIVKDKQVKELQNEIASISNKNNNSEQDLVSKTQNLEHLNNVINAQKQENTELLEKLDEMYKQKQSQDSQLDFLCYNFKRLSGLSNTESQVIFKIDLEGDFIMEIYTQNNYSMVPCQYISDIQLAQNPPTISITVKADQIKKTFDFQCSGENLISISEQIKSFRRRALKSKKKPILNAQLNIVSQGKNQGSLMNGVFSMFKN